VRASATKRKNAANGEGSAITIENLPKYPFVKVTMMGAFSGLHPTVAAVQTAMRQAGIPLQELSAFYAEVACLKTRETPADQGFHGFRGWVFWLLQGQWDRRVQEFEGSAPGGGGDGEQVEAGLVLAGDA
jgi:hypothetical protein